MTQVITTPDGVEHEFPDGASDDVIKNALKSYSGGSKPPPKSDIAQPTDSLPGLNPLTATTGDYLAKLHQAVGGLGQLGQKAVDYGRVAANTFGQGDIGTASIKSLYGDLTGTGSDLPAALKAEQAKTAAASEDLGKAGTIAANITGSGPMTAAGIGKGVAKAAAPYVKPYVAGLIGGATEGGTIGGASSLGKGEDVGWGTLIGSLFGLGGGVLGGTGRGASVPKAADRVALEADQAAKLAALKQPKFNPNDVDSAYRDAVVSLDPAQRANISYGFRQNVIRNRAENARTGGTSAADVNGFARNPFDAVRTNGDNVLAARIRDNLVGPKGILATAKPTTGHAPGEAFDLHNAFQTSTAKLGDHDWLTNTNINKAPAEAAEKLKSGSGMLYDQAGKDALQRLADLQRKQTTPGAWQGFKDYVTGAATDKTLGAGLGWLAHGIPGILGDLGVQAGAATIKGARAGAKADTVQRAMDAAKVATTTGRPTTPFEMLPPAPMRDFARKVLNTGGTNF